MPKSRSRFNKLTDDELERLALLSEELGECIQAIGKIMRHGYESTHPDGGLTNREILEIECGDVGNALHLLCENGDLSMGAMERRAFDKRTDVIKYMHCDENRRTPCKK